MNSLIKAVYTSRYSIKLERQKSTGRYLIQFRHEKMTADAIFSFKRYEAATTLFDAQLASLRSEWGV